LVKIAPKNSYSQRVLVPEKLVFWANFFGYTFN
jgi:hypothetical protein